MIAFYALDPSNSEVQLPGSEIYHIYPLTNLSIFQVQRGRFKLDMNPINYDGYTYYSSYEPPPLELYTKFSLFGYFIVFWAVISLHILTILIVDKIWIRNVPKTAGLWNRILHAVQKSHLPFPYTNWHEEKGSCSDHLKRYKEVKIEVLVDTVINLCFNLVLLTPLLILCKFMSSILSITCKYSQLTFFSDTGILERHKQLENTIGVLDIELKSLERSKMFTWIFYPSWIILATIQIVCFILSNGRFHPLANILKGCKQTNCTGMITFAFNLHLVTPELFFYSL